MTITRSRFEAWRSRRTTLRDEQSGSFVGCLRASTSAVLSPLRSDRGD